MPTYELRCAQCQDVKWPTLADRPDRYVCVLCRMLPEAKREARRVGAQKRVAARRKTAPTTATDSRSATISGAAIPTPPPRRCAACQVTLDAPSEYKDDRGRDLCPSCFWKAVSA